MEYFRTQLIWYGVYDWIYVSVFGCSNNSLAHYLKNCSSEGASGNTFSLSYVFICGGFEFQSGDLEKLLLFVYTHSIIRLLSSTCSGV